MTHSETTIRDTLLMHMDSPHGVMVSALRRAAVERRNRTVGDTSPLLSDDFLDMIRELRELSENIDTLITALVEVLDQRYSMSQRHICAETGLSRITHRSRRSRDGAQEHLNRVLTALTVAQLIPPPQNPGCASSSYPVSDDPTKT